jgi:diacylglycerol kinase (ATP)
VTSSEGGERQATGRWKRVRLIWNTAAGSKGGISTNSASRDQLLDLMQRMGLGSELRATDSAAEARALTADAVRKEYDLVVAAGGDGTIGTVATGLLDTDTALGIIPLGSVMNVPRSLGLPREIEGAGEALRDGHVHAIDIGEANGRPFFEAGSVGLNAAMFREAQRFDRGDWFSVVRTVAVALRYRPARMVIRLDDRVIRTRALMVNIANGPYTGMALMVAPDAQLDDGQFDIVIFRRFSKFQLLRHLASIAFGRRRYAPEVSTYRSHVVRIESRHPLPCRADSHDLGTTPVEFRVRPRALRVVLPAHAPDAAVDATSRTDSPDAG